MQLTVIILGLVSILQSCGLLLLVRKLRSLKQNPEDTEALEIVRKANVFQNIDQIKANYSSFLKQKH